MPESEIESHVTGSEKVAEEGSQAVEEVGGVEEPVVNEMKLEVMWAKRVPGQWVHADSGDPPGFPDNVFEFEFGLELGGDTPRQSILKCVVPGGKVTATAAQTTDDAECLEAAASTVLGTGTDLPGPSQVTTKTNITESEDKQPSTTPTTESPPPPPPCNNDIKVTWDQDEPHTISLTAPQLTALQAAVESPSLQYTLRRTLKTSKAAPDWEDVNEVKYRATAVVPLDGFAEPGTTTVTFTDVALRPLVVEDDKVEDKKGKKAVKKPAKGSQVPGFLLTEEEWEVHPYEANGTSVSFKISFESALVCLPGERPRPDIKPADLIPERAKPAKHVPNAPRLFSAEVREIIHSIVSDYRKYSDTAQRAQSVEESRKAFLQYLSSSGRSFAYKQKLKHCVVRIVKEKFAKKSGAAKEEMERFYNELYVYLLDQMHYSMNNTLARTELEAPTYTPEEGVSDKWLRLATEAEVVQEYELAERFHQERLVHGPAADQDEEGPGAWVAYAKFCLRVRDTVKAEQAFKEAISLDITHVPSLLGYGLLLLSTDRPKEAEVFFQAAVDSALEDPLPWACLSLFFERMAAAEGEPEDIINRYKKWAKYSRVQATRAQAGVVVERAEDEPGSVPPSPKEKGESIDMMMARYTLGLRFEGLAGHCLVNEKRRGETLETKHLEAVVMHQTKDYEGARRTLKEILSKGADQRALLLLGDIYADMGGDDVEDGGRTCQASVLGEEAYDKALRMGEDTVGGEVLIRLGNLCCSLGRYRDACDAFMLGVKQWPCGTTWMGVGVSYYRLGEYDHAAQAFGEANYLNNLNARTWAYISLVSLKQCPGQEEQADQAFHQALQLGLADHAILLEIGTEHLRLGRHKLAKAAFLKSITTKETPTAHLLLGITYTQLREYFDAKKEFKIVVETAEGEGERAKAEEELEMLERVKEEVLE